MSLFIACTIGKCADFTTYVNENNIYHSQSTISQLAMDAAGNTWTTGSNAFLAKLDTDGNITFKTTLIKSFSYSYGSAIALDPSGDVWVAGQTDASDLPLVNPV